MTGEHKLALIISFAVVLLVGVLISDHLSEAQHATIEPAEGEHLPLVVQAPGPAEIDALARQKPPPTDPIARPRLEGGAGVPPGGATTGLPVGDALTRALPRMPEPVLIVQGDSDAAWERPAELNLDPPPPADDPTPGTIGSLFERLRTAAGSGPSPRPETPARVEPPTRVPPPAPEPAKVHHVRKNESLYAIAKQHYGDGNLWRKLAEANADRVGPEGSVREGVAIRLPADLSGAATRSAAATAQPTAREAARRSTPPAGSGERSYVVKSGEVLGQIAQRELGSARRVGDILALNPAIKDADDIRAGMTLRLPKE